MSYSVANAKKSSHMETRRFYPFATHSIAKDGLFRCTAKRSAQREQDLSYSFATYSVAKTFSSLQTNTRNKICSIPLQCKEDQGTRSIIFFGNAQRCKQDVVNHLIPTGNAYHYTVFPLLFSTSTRDTKEQIHFEFPMHLPVPADAPQLLTFSFTPGRESCQKFLLGSD